MVDKTDSCEGFFISILQALSFCTLLVSIGKYFSPQYYFYYLIAMVILIMAALALYTERVLPNVKENAKRTDNLLEVDKPKRKQPKVSILVQDVDNPTYSRVESHTESYEILSVKDLPKKTEKQALSYQKAKDYVENNNFDVISLNGDALLQTDGRKRSEQQLDKTRLKSEQLDKTRLSSKDLRKRRKKGLVTSGSSDTEEPSSSSFLGKHLSRSFDNLHRIYNK